MSMIPMPMIPLPKFKMEWVNTFVEAIEAVFGFVVFSLVIGIGVATFLSFLLQDHSSSTLVPVSKLVESASPAPVSPFAAGATAEPASTGPVSAPPSSTAPALTAEPASTTPVSAPPSPTVAAAEPASPASVSASPSPTVAAEPASAAPVSAPPSPTVAAAEPASAAPAPPSPTVAAAEPAGGAAASAPPSPTAAAAEPASAAAASAPPSPAVAAAEPASAAAASAPPSPTAAAADPASAAPVSAPPSPAVAAAEPTSAAPVSAPPSSTAPAAEPDHNEIAALLARGRATLSSGDVAGARVFLRRAAEHNDPQAAFALGETYDPVVLRNLGVVKFNGDAALAREWYRRAADWSSSAPEAAGHATGRSALLIDPTASKAAASDPGGDHTAESPARPQSTEQKTAAMSQDEICMRDAAQLTNLRISQARDEVIRFEHELSCEKLRPQVIRLRESVDPH